MTYWQRIVISLKPSRTILRMIGTIKTIVHYLLKAHTKSTQSIIITTSNVNYMNALKQKIINN